MYPIDTLLDPSHINTPSTVTGYAPDNDGLAKTLDGADIVLIPAGVPRKPGMTRDDLFNVRLSVSFCSLKIEPDGYPTKTNASIVRDLAKAAAKNGPQS